MHSHMTFERKPLLALHIQSNAFSIGKGNFGLTFNV